MQKTSINLFLITCLITSLLAIQPDNTEAAGVGAGGKVSSLGVGGELVGGVMDNLNLRAGIQGITYDYDDTYSGIYYEAELELFSTMLLLDFFPLSNNFRISGGMMLNKNELIVTGTAEDGTYNIGGVTYPSSLVGSVTGTMDFNTVSPYVGFGYGGLLTESGDWHFFMDIGILYQGSPNLSYTATGPLANNPTFQADLEREKQELEEDIDEFEYYPVISMGIMYQF